jgi:hypothetical protein
MGRGETLVPETQPQMNTDIRLYVCPSVVILRPVGYYSVRGAIWNGGAIVGTGTSMSVG